MKKISFVIILFICLLCLSSCKKSKYVTYNIGEEQKFFDQVYEFIDKENNNYCLVDVRELETSYASGHFRGFINYDIKNGSVDEFVYKMKSMYSLDKAIFIIDEDGTDVTTLMDALKDEGYKKIYIYLGGYQKLNEANNSDFVVVTGTDDCGC